MLVVNLAAAAAAAAASGCIKHQSQTYIHTPNTRCSNRFPRLIYPLSIACLVLQLGFSLADFSDCDELYGPRFNCYVHRAAECNCIQILLRVVVN
ncbi:hypothetical protein BD289DRAFT_429393 [Coniella lustricola]|uniref:Uncharacterized protein n=1 Tax=Coniella lustricola TaxID=2025994 RepID=A0A2T3ACT9_9PEZI|nr:hypothetical protein BD289DRAFT_429393 [Coniella lustricola]